LVPAKGR